MRASTCLIDNGRGLFDIAKRVDETECRRSTQVCLARQGHTIIARIEPKPYSEPGSNLGHEQRFVFDARVVRVNQLLKKRRLHREGNLIVEAVPESAGDSRRVLNLRLGQKWKRLTRCVDSDPSARVQRSAGSVVAYVVLEVVAALRPKRVRILIDESVLDTWIGVSSRTRRPPRTRARRAFDIPKA